MIPNSVPHFTPHVSVVYVFLSFSCVLPKGGQEGVVWVGFDPNKTACTVILSKTADTHVTQLYCSKHTHNDAICNQKCCILVQQYTIYRVKDRSHTSFKIQSGNFKCDLPIVSKCLIQQCKVHVKGQLTYSDYK